MKSKLPRKIVSGILAVLMLCSVTACNQQSTKPTADAVNSPSSKTPLEYTVYLSAYDSAPAFADPKNDVLAKYILDKFNIKVKAVYANNGMTMKQKINLFIASNTMPDVSFCINDNITFPATGLMADLTDLVPKYCPNLMKLWPKSEWKTATYNGRLYCMPNLLVNASDPKYKNDVYTAPTTNWAGIWTTESVLKKCGYTFTPSADIIAKVNKTQTNPSADDLKITPAITTPEDFYTFLQKVKTAYGPSVIPFNTWIALEPHLGTMFGATAGQWKYDSATKQVSSSLGDTNAKKYWQYMNKLYSDGLLDKDFAIEKDDQRQENIVQGKIKSFMYTSDIAKVQQAVTKADPSDSLRQIPLPQEAGTVNPGIDQASPATFRYYINKNFKDIPRLLQFFDWTLSDEYNDIATWGTKDLGLYTVNAAGKKVFKDDSLYQALVKGDTDTVKAKYTNYGLTGANFNSNLPGSLIGAASPHNGYNPSAWQRSYPINKTLADPTYLASFINTKGLKWDGTLLGGIDDTTNASSLYYAQVFEQQQSPKLFAAKSQAEFDQNWNSIYKDFLKAAKYTDAQQEMEQQFANMGLDVKSSSTAKK